MKEAWLIIYTDPQSYEVSFEFTTTDPEYQKWGDKDTQVKHIVYAEIE